MFIRFHAVRHRPLRWLCLGFSGLVLQAQDASRPTLTLTEALTRAIARNPSLAADAFGERAADALVEQAGLRPNPRLELEFENFIGTGRMRGVDDLETTLQASQTLERGGKRAKRIAVAGHEREIAAKTFAVRRSEITAAAALAFVEALAAEQRLALAEAPLALARETVALTDARLRAGESSAAESARARAALATSNAEITRARANVTAARAALAATWGGVATEVPPLDGTLQLPDAVPSEESLRANLSRHPKLDLQRAVIAARRAQIELERAQAVQDITVGGGVRFFRDTSDTGFVAGVSMPIPVRNKNQGNIRAARENLAAAEATLRAIENGLQTELSGVWQNLQAAHATAQSLRRDALPPTEEAHAAVRRAYQQGELGLLDVLEAQRALIAVRKEILEAELAYLTALVRAETSAATSCTLTAQLLSPK